MGRKGSKSMLTWGWVETGEEGGRGEEEERKEELETEEDWKRKRSECSQRTFFSLPSSVMIVPQ